MEGFPAFNQNNPESGPKLFSREEVVSLLRDRGIDDEEVKSALVDYQVALEQLSYTAPDGQDECPRLAIHMAEIYFEANYREYAIESMQQLLDLSLTDTVRIEVESALDKMVEKVENDDFSL